jgi:hypothetical protein
MNQQVIQTLINEAMEGIDDARRHLLRAARALDELGVDRHLHRDVLFAMEETRDLAARLIEHVGSDEI